MCLAIPGQIVELDPQEPGLARVEIAGVRRTVNIMLLEPEGAIGDWVLVHVGFALARVDEAEAQATLELLRGLGNDFEAAVDELRSSTVQ